MSKLRMKITASGSEYSLAYTTPSGGSEFHKSLDYDQVVHLAEEIINRHEGRQIDTWENRDA